MASEDHDERKEDQVPEHPSGSVLRDLTDLARAQRAGLVGQADASAAASRRIYRDAGPVLLVLATAHPDGGWRTVCSHCEAQGYAADEAGLDAIAQAHAAETGLPVQIDRYDLPPGSGAWGSERL